MGSTSTGDRMVAGGEGLPETVAVTSKRRFITVADDGAHVPLRVGESVELIVGAADASDPQIEGDAVEVIAISNITASGKRHWEVRARKPGTSRIRVMGARPLSIMLEVTP